jgi:predicted porin
MQKKIIALAVAGLMSGAAFAQSNVTIYGVADATFDFIRASGSTVSANSNVNLKRVATNSSLIGFKGSEDLGGGMKALFQFESSVGFDAAGAFAANRDSYVGLSSGFGTVLLGNLTGPTRAFGAAVDVNAGATGIGANTALIGKLGNLLTGTLNTATVSGAATGQVTGVAAGARSATYASAYDNRFQNAIAYVSPTFGGLTAIAGYVANEGKNDGPAGTFSDPSAFDLGLKYANGPILVGLAYAKVSLDNSVDTETKNTRLVGSYDFGMASVRLLWDQGKADVTGSSAKQTVWGIGGTFNVSGNGKIIGQYYKAADVKGSGLGSGSDTGAKLFALGYEHSLSKRTMLKAVYSKLSNEAAAQYEFAVNGTGLASAAGAAGTDLTGFSFGVRHTF